jgi:hypothetical protein
MVPFEVHDGDAPPETRDAKIEKALTPDSPPADAAKAAEPDDEPKSTLFDDPDDEDWAVDPALEDTADDDAGDDDDTTLFEGDEPAKIPKGWTKGTWKRFQTVLHQRNDLRGEVAAEKESNQTLKEALEAAKGLSGLIGEKYKDYTNPLAQVKFDADFMDALEQAGVHNPGYKQMAQEIKQYMDTGSLPNMSTTNPLGPPPHAPAAPAVEPKPDPRVDALLQQNARKVVTDTLETQGVKPAFRTLIADHVVASGADLTALDKAAVLKAARDFAVEKGFTGKDILTGAPSKDDPKPATSTSQTKGAVTPKAKAAGEAEGPKQAKTMEEWSKNRENYLRDQFGSSD